MHRVLTKSRFKLGLECPNKLFYTRKEGYANKKVEDPFLEALAQGGFQVEELARMYYPNGVLIDGDDWDYESLWAMTQELLKQENVTIYEAAFLFDGLFIRTDILVKTGNSIELIEVKSKSYLPTDDYIFVGKRGKLVSGWKSYLFDIAFQKYVMQSCFPNWSISSFIMMADKSAIATIDGLNQLFRITSKVNKRTGIQNLANSLEELGEMVLGKKNISEIINDIEENKYQYYSNLTFQNAIKTFKYHYQNDLYYNWPTSFQSCKACEFRASNEEELHGLKSGFKECFQNQHKWDIKEFERAQIFEIWNFRKGTNLFEDGIYFMDELDKDDLNYKEENTGLSSTERQWLQIEKTVNLDEEVYVDKENLKQEFENWIYPLHFIDFESSAVALPFNKGRKPYEQIAFQFSHHIFHEDGRIEHASEYINNRAGFFPNFEFIRALYDALGDKSGTIFQYSQHENTILNAIYMQLLDSNEPDKEQLMVFIQKISHSSRSSQYAWRGDRDMVDLFDIVKKYYYNPLTMGSNSIKDVLPAALSSSSFLKAKYSQKIQDCGITSKNFSKDHIWLSIEKGKIVNPYKKLPSVFNNWSEEEIENTLSEIEDIANGAAALTAYGKLQYTEMNISEVEVLTNALLKYCELDTLAMVMIFEHFKEDLI